MPKAPSDKLRQFARLVAVVVPLLLDAACFRDPSASRQRPDSQVDESPTPMEEALASTPQPLELGDPVARALAPGETHTYRIEVAEDHFLQAVVDQQGVDVKATLFEPDGRQLIQVDRPIDDTGPESLMAVAKIAGSFMVRVSAAVGKRPIGRYEIRVEHLRPATAEDRSRAAALVLFSNAKAAYSRQEYQLAAGEFEQALAAWSELGDRSWQGESHVRLGQSHAKLRDWQTATVHYQQAAEFFHAQGNARWEAIAWQKLGVVFYSLRELDQAAVSFEKALPLRQQAGDRRGEAITLQSLAQIHQLRDEIQQALESYSLALELFERPNYRARTHHNLGVLYLSLGRIDRARDALRAAERAWSEAGDRQAQATAINQLGELYRQSGELKLALDHYRRALELRRELQDRPREATSLANIGLVHQARGETDQAQVLFLEALEILKDLRRPRFEARVLLNLGSLHLERRRVPEALKAFGDSLDLYRDEVTPTGEAEALAGFARAERQRGDLTAALEYSAAALGLLESVRPRAVSLESRASFFATVQDHFDFHIDLLMQLHLLEPDAGYDARALVSSERARARSLLDLLVESGSKIRSGADPELLEQERELQRRLNARERERYQLRKSSTHRPESDKAVELALRQLEEVRDKIRARHPRYAALTQPLSLPELQEQLLDEDTLLLEYRLGTERSFLWALSTRSLDSFVLPRRDVIEPVARKAYDLLLNSHRRENWAATGDVLCDLGRMLLRPVAAQIARKRLLIVADGALQLIPFAVLARPDDSEDACRTAPPLVVGHEITHLLSASALAIHRRQLGERTPAERSVAVVADPVFSLEDPRFTSTRSEYSNTSSSDLVSAADGRRAEAALTRSTDMDLRSLTRLPFSRREADTILSLSKGKRSFSALDFDANKESLVGGVLEPYRIVHFATHGVLNTKYPELSGIVLSLFDREGRSQDGFLRAHEIYTLELASELVVLSACSTALGKVVRGEGLLSLTRGFLYAGAERVMVSLWNVNDESTAELMARVYDGLLKRDLRPAAALREAQISMLADPRRAAPYYWAGFVIQGEWR